MRTLGFALLALVSTAFAPSADAQPESAYYGLSIGEIDFSEEINGLVFADSVSAWHLMVGYQFMEYLAVEGSYGQSSTIRSTRTFTSSNTGVQNNVDYVSDFGQILTVRLVGVLPFDNGLSLMAGLGFADMKQDIEIFVDGAQFASGEASGNNQAYYVGVQYDWDRIGLRLAHEKYDFDEDFVDADELSLTFFYRL